MKAFRYQSTKIALPGAYVDVPITTYHAQPCDGPSVSSSKLRLMERSPLHFWTFCPWNPDHIEQDDSDPLRLGRAAHVLALEPELFDAQFVVSPFDDFRTKDARAWRDEQAKTVLKPGEFDNLRDMAAALRKHPEAVALFRNGLPELTFAAKDEPTGLWLLSRPDFTPASPGRGLVDYKTAADASPEAWSRNAFNLGIPLQVALALDVVAMIEGELRPTMWHVCQERDPPYAVSVMRWEPEQIMWGRRRVRQLLDAIARCRDAREWPSYDTPTCETTFEP